MVKHYRIRADTMDNIGSIVQKKRFAKTRFTGAQIAAEIAKIQTGIPIHVATHIGQDGQWKRPAGWPDLDAIPIDRSEGSTQQVLYMSYDNLREDMDKFLSLTCTVSPADAGWDISIGTVSDGVFSPYENAHLANNGKYGRLLTTEDPDYPVVRITSTGGITSLQLTAYPADTSARPRYANGAMQPMIERVGYLPDATHVSSGWGSYFLERESVSVGHTLKSLYAAWQSCYSLQSLDIGGWDVSSVTTLASAWYNCYSLQSLDIGGWDVSSVTALAYSWQSCYSLQSLDIGGWDVSSVTTLAYSWNACYSLQSLDIGGWDVSSVTTLYAAWQSCYSLQSLDIGGWDVSSVTTLVYAWQSCYSLQSLDIGGWDVSGVTSLAYSWNACYSLQSLHPPVFYAALSFAQTLLPRQSLVLLLHRLAPASKSTTISLGATLRQKLTSDEIKIATDKGWTVA